MNGYSGGAVVTVAPGTEALPGAATVPGSLPAAAPVALPDRIFVRKVKQEIGREDLAEHFSRFGSVTDVYLPTVPGVSGHKGIAFITFSEASTVQLVMQYVPHTILGCEVMVDVASPRSEPAQIFGAQQTAVATPPAMLQPAAMPLAAPSAAGVAERGGAAAGGTSGFSMDVLAQAEAQLAAMNGITAPASAIGAMAQQPHDGTITAAAVTANALMGASAPATSLAALLGGSFTPAVGVFGAPRAFAGNSAIRPPAGVPVHGRIFVTKVAPNITRYDLQAYFAQFGKMTDCYLPANKGIAFVSYEDPEVAQRVLLNKEHVVKAGQAVFVEQAMDRGDAPPGIVAKGPQSGIMVPGRLFVTNVQPAISRQDLQMYFSQFGNLSDCYTPNNGKGIAFVSFADPKDAERVLLHRDHVVKGLTISVEQAVDRSPTGKGGAAPFQSAGKGAPAGSQQLQAYSVATGAVQSGSLAYSGIAGGMASVPSGQSYGTMPMTAAAQQSSVQGASTLASQQAQELSALLKSATQPASMSPAVAQQQSGTTVASAGQQGFDAGSGTSQVGAANRFMPY